MTLKLVINQHWDSLQARIAELQNRLYEAQPLLKLSITVEESKYTNIPFKDFPSGFNTPSKIIDRDWYKANITPKGIGYDYVAFVVPWDMWQGGGTAGITNWNNGKYEIELGASENQMGGNGIYLFIDSLLHELRHAIIQDKHGFDDTHSYLWYNHFDLKGAYAFYPSTMIKIRTIGWEDQEKGLYFPFDTEARQAELIKKLTEIFPDYIRDTQEYKLGKRPWK